MASRRLASSGKEANYRETGENEDEEDEEWIEPIKVTSKNNRRHRDKNSPRRTKVSGSSSKLGSYSGTSSSSSSTKGDMWNFITAAGEFALYNSLFLTAIYALVVQMIALQQLILHFSSCSKTRSLHFILCRL